MDVLLHNKKVLRDGVLGHVDDEGNFTSASPTGPITETFTITGNGVVKTVTPTEPKDLRDGYWKEMGLGGIRQMFGIPQNATVRLVDPVTGLDRVLTGDDNWERFRVHAGATIDTVA